MTERLEIKATLVVTDAGEIVGTAWPFGSPDSVGDIITKGAINVAVSDLPMLFGHRPDDLVGTWSETTETPDGFVVKGKLHLEQPRARSVLAMVKSGLVSGLSIGFKTKASSRTGHHRTITALDLFEVSLVTNPSHPRAQITSAKSLNSAQAIAAAISRAAAHIKGSN